MSKVLPPAKQDQIAFFNQHITTWQSAAATIGLVVTEVDSFKLLVEAAIAAESNAFASRNASRAATKTYDTAFDKMSEVGRALIATIKAYAEKTDDPDVYSRAELPSPKPAAPAPPPETPTMLRAAIRAADGVTILQWDGSTQGGVNFTVHRAIFDGSGYPAPVLVGTVGVRTFEDSTIPSCTQAVQYFVRAWRGDKASPFSEPLAFRYTPGAAPGDEQQQVAQAA